MKRLMIVSTFLLFHFNGDAQSQITTPATPDQVEFLRYVMSSIASPFIDPQVAKMNAADFVILFGLNSQEETVLQTAGQAFATAINNFRSQEDTITTGNKPISEPDRAAISAAATQLNTTVSALANQILASVRPGTANLFRQQGDLNAIATTGKMAGGNLK